LQCCYKLSSKFIHEFFLQINRHYTQQAFSAPEEEGKAPRCHPSRDLIYDQAFLPPKIASKTLAEKNLSQSKLIK
jgi:hypothetical protein